VSIANGTGNDGIIDPHLQPPGKMIATFATDDRKPDGKSGMSLDFFVALNSYFQCLMGAGFVTY